MASRSPVNEPGSAYISTCHLPGPEMVRALIDDAYRRFRLNNEGKNSQVYPALARVPSELFGLCVVSTGGEVYRTADVDYEFSIMIATICQKPEKHSLSPKTAAMVSARWLGPDAEGAISDEGSYRSCRDRHSGRRFGCLRQQSSARNRGLRFQL
jgi:glutaminase